jgi:hypothetical protein
LKVEEKIINKVRFVDNMIIAKTEEELQDIMNRVVDTRRMYHR